MKEQSLLPYFATIAAFLLLLGALFFFSDRALNRFKQNCIERGGEPTVIRSEVVCFKQGALI